MTAASRPDQPTFTILDLAMDVNVVRWLKLWDIAPPTPVAFGVSTADSETPVWRSDFPAMSVNAHTALLRTTSELVAETRALQRAEQRLRQFVATQRSRTQDGVSFEVLPQPEADLSSLLSELGDRRTVVRYDLHTMVNGRWEQLTQQFQDWLNHLMRLASYNAVVETAVAGDPKCRTVVRWTGDMTTVWLSRVTSVEMALHQQTLALTLASRATLMHTLVAILRGAVQLGSIAMLVTTPLGALLSLPAAWQFFNLVRDEIVRKDTGREEHDDAE